MSWWPAESPAHLDWYKLLYPNRNMSSEDKFQVLCKTYVTLNRCKICIIQDALAQIPEEFREVVVLRDVQQLAYEEIADITGLPMATVKSRINRGRTKLQGILQEVYSPEEA